jgi:sugar phosphate isomerase/epimerase
MKYTRRELGKLALTALPAAHLLGTPSTAWARRATKPNSKFAGVQVGMNVPYNFGGRDMNADEVLDRCLTLGVSAVEMRSQPVEGFLGSPAAAAARASVGAQTGRGTASPAQQAAQSEALRKWRMSISMDRVRAFRRKYNDAGVLIEIVKYDGIYNMADDEIDYCFTLAKTLGARAISCEIDLPQTKRLGQFADKHKVMVGLHGHAATTPAHWETAFSYAKYNGANLDIGHFLAGNNTSPIPFLKQHHARITHIHVKDRKLNEGPNTPFGQGDTPIKETLQVIRDNKWPIQATIEFEYPVPAGSDRLAELAKCMQFCKDALLA